MQTKGVFVQLVVELPSSLQAYDSFVVSVRNICYECFGQSFDTFNVSFTFELLYDISKLCSSLSDVCELGFYCSLSSILLIRSIVYVCSPLLINLLDFPFYISFLPLYLFFYFYIFIHKFVFWSLMCLQGYGPTQLPLCQHSSLDQ